MANVGRACPRRRCPYSHLPYVDLFVQRLNTELISHDPRDIPECTPTFYPILALVPSSSPPRYLVSFPIPRSRYVVAGLVGRGGSVRQALHNIAGVLCNTAFGRAMDQYEADEEPVDWLTMSTVGEMEQVDVMMEGVFWLLEAGVHIDIEGRDGVLAGHLMKFKSSRTAMVAGGEEFCSLTSRRAPPLPASLLPIVASPSASSSSSSSSAPFELSDGPAEEDGETPVVPDSSHDVPSSSSHSDLSSWYEAGRSVEWDSAVLVPESSSALLLFIRCLPHTTFACLPIAADVRVRDAFSYDRLDCVMKVSEVEDECRVSVFVPAMAEKKQEVKEGKGSEWLNVTVWKNSEEGSADGGKERELVEQAVRALVTRYEAVRRLLLLDPSSAEQPTPPAGGRKRSITSVEQSDQQPGKRVRV